MSADGRDLVRRTSEGAWLLDIAADATDGSFWVADYLDGLLEEYRADGVPLRRVEVPGARALALDPGGGSVYVGSFSVGLVERRSRAGDLEWRDDSVGPVDALFSPRPGEVWVASATGVVRMYRNDEELFSIDDFTRPIAFASAAGNRIFILDHDAKEVRAFDYAGFPMGSTGAIFLEPTDVEGDGGDGAWVADAGRGGLVRIDGRLRESGFVAAPGALGVTLDPRDGVLWVAGEGHVRRFLPDGTRLSDLSVGSRPIKVAIYHEGSRS